MLSDTLTNELERYAIGPRIKALRLKKKLGLVQLAAHTGLSSAMLSKIERGQMFPTLPTLLRIAMVFGVGLDHFFSPEKEKPLVAVVRKEQRLKLPAPPNGKPPAFLFESLDYPVANRKMEAFYAEFPARRAAIGSAPAWQRGVHLRSRRPSGCRCGRGTDDTQRRRRHVFQLKRSPQLPSRWQASLHSSGRDCTKHIETLG